MINLACKKLKSHLSFKALMVVTILSGCASKVDTANEQQAINNFVAKAGVAEQLKGADEVNWWHKLESTQLNELVIHALASNYDLHTSQLTLKLLAWLKS